MIARTLSLVLFLLACSAPIAMSAAAGPGEITASQIHGLVAELDAELEAVRSVLGTAPAGPPSIVVYDAQPREVLQQAIELLARTRQLSVQELDELGPPVRLPDREEPALADVHHVVSAALDRVRAVREVYQVEPPSPGRRVRPGDSAADLYDALLAASRRIPPMLYRRVDASDAQGQVTDAMGLVTAMLGRSPQRPAVESAPRVPDRALGDVHARLLDCLETVRRVGGSMGLAMLRAEPRPAAASGRAQIGPLDVHEVAGLLLSEVAHLHDRLEADEVVDLAASDAPAGAAEAAGITESTSLLQARLEELERQVGSMPAAMATTAGGR